MAAGNPAKPDLRLPSARAWRKQRTRPVTVINLIAENSLEQRMLDTLALKRTVADSVLDHPGQVTEISLRSGRQAFLERLEQLLTPEARRQAKARAATPAIPPLRPTDPAQAFAEQAHAHLAHAHALARRFPEPPSLEDALLPPLSAAWGEALPVLRAFVNDPAAPWQPLAEKLAAA